MLILDEQRPDAVLLISYAQSLLANLIEALKSAFDKKKQPDPSTPFVRRCGLRSLRMKIPFQGVLPSRRKTTAADNNLCATGHLCSGRGRLFADDAAAVYLNLQAFGGGRLNDLAH